MVSGVTATRVSGNSQSGSYAFTMQTALSAKSGDKYKIQVRASDAAGNYSAWTDVSEFTVLPPTPDTERPVIVAGSGVVEKSTVTFTEIFTFTFRATDNVGVAGAGGIIYRPDNYPVGEIDSGRLISGSSQDGVWRVSISVPRRANPGGVEQDNPLGTYSVYAKASDSSGNAMRLSNGNYYIYIGTVSVTG